MQERCRHEIIIGSCSTCNAEEARVEVIRIFRELEMETKKEKGKMTIDLKNDKPGDLFISETGILNKLSSFCAEPTATMEDVLTGGKVGGSIHSPNLKGFKRISDVDKEDLISIIKYLAIEHSSVVIKLDHETAEHAKTRDKLAVEMTKEK